MGEQVKLRRHGAGPDPARRASFRTKTLPSFIGLRPGEKLYEELVGISEVAGPSRIEKIHRVTSRTPPNPEFFKSLEDIDSGRRRKATSRPCALVEDAHSPSTATPLKSRRFRRRRRSKTPPRSTQPNSTKWRTAKGRAVSVLSELHFGQGAPLTCAHHCRAHAPQLGPERLFRCDACGWRGWLMPLVSIESGLADQAPAPNLAEVDEAVSRSLPAARPTFLPRNLQ